MSALGHRAVTGVGELEHDVQGLEVSETKIATLRQFRDFVQGARLEQGLTQAQLAEKSGVSRKWLGDFERGNPNARLGLVLAVMDALGANLTVNFESPYLGFL